MKRLIKIGFLVLSYTTLPQPVASFPTLIAASEAYVAYEQNICRALIDVCEGVASASPQHVEKLACHPG